MSKYVLALLKSPYGESPPPPRFGPRRFVPGSSVKGRSERKRAIWKNAGKFENIYFYLDLGVSVYLRPSFGEAGHSNFGRTLKLKQSQNR